MFLIPGNLADNFGHNICWYRDQQDNSNYSVHYVTMHIIDLELYNQGS